MTLSKLIDLFVKHYRTQVNARTHAHSRAQRRCIIDEIIVLASIAYDDDLLLQCVTPPI